jgi:hypothetical protein
MMLNKDNVRELIRKYWNAGMNNAYWSSINENVEADLNRMFKGGDNGGK